MSSGPSASSNDPSSSVVLRTTKKRSIALSCAECRRLKLRCSRIFPCSNCQKKGCAAICMSFYISLASLTTGKGNRFVLADTEELHDKVQELSARIRTLEDALALSHVLHSNQPHPLLSETLRQIKRPLEREMPRLSVSSGEMISAAEDAATAMGSLTVHDTGRSTFHSTFASSWHLLTNEDEELDEQKQTQIASMINLPTSLPWLSSSFPFSPTQFELEMDGVRGEILKHLPPPDVAKTRAQTYFSDASFMFTPVQAPDFWERVYRPTYEHASRNETVSSHTLALLFIVIGFGAHMDSKSPPMNPEALMYYHLSRASLSLESVLERPTLEGIQALIVMAHFMFFADIDEPRWMIMGLVIKMTYSAKLSTDRDPSRWNMNEAETQRRRIIFWEVFVYDSLLSFGRPPSFPKLHMDTKYPSQQVENSKGDTEMRYSSWKYRFMSDCLSQVHDQVFSAKAPTYKTCKELARQVSEYHVPENLQVRGVGNTTLPSQTPNRFLMLERNVGFAIREMTFFYLHRGWFAQALEESPDDPLRSKYSQSVLASYSTACKYVALVENWYKQEPVLLERMWFIFSHVFSCCIILGNIAAMPKLSIANSALFYLEVGYSLFLEVSSSPKRAKVLPTLQKLRDRAHAFRSPKTSMLPEQADVVVENATRLSFVGPKVQQGDGRVTILHDQPVLGSQRQKSNTPPPFSSESPESTLMIDSISPTSSQSRIQPVSWDPIQDAPWLQIESPESSSRASSTHLHFSPPPIQVSHESSSTSPLYDPFTDTMTYQPVLPPQQLEAYDMLYQGYSVPAPTQPIKNYPSAPEQRLGSLDSGTVAGLPAPQSYSHCSHSPFLPMHYSQQDFSGGTRIESGGDFSRQEPERHVNQAWQAFFAQYK
ncbi:hypothetical protein DL96DRAFT_1492094 [Flagelloscypha sp. PMI_526]|nr:hypothetical protein DL96DRAFT_1492094 [Flagelloscypha sp. PMI_526]